DYYCSSFTGRSTWVF
nr:immunoglobulin light chain junction region [Macaca mulatta]